MVFAEKKYGFHALCLVPRYMHFIHLQEMYHINKLLAYFRRKLYVGETPTIISNDCVGGEIYDMMDMLMLSPTVNIGLNDDDFLKFCNNPKKYLNIEATRVFWQKDRFGRKDVVASPAIRLDDITVLFAHTDSTTESNVADRWNSMRGHINFDHMIFVYRANNMPVSVRFIREFNNMQNNHLFIMIGDGGLICRDVDYLLLRENYFCRTDTAIENYFDVLEWMNDMWCG